MRVGKNCYLLQIKNRVWEEIEGKLQDIIIMVGGKELHPEAVYTDGFCQDGHNGADYILVVDDDAVADMELYFTGIAFMFPEDIPENLVNDAWADIFPYSSRALFPASGTDDIMLQVTNILVAQEMRKSKEIFVMMIFLLLYIGLIYLCVTLAVLSVQQLSDSEKNKQRYRILSLLGAGRRKKRYTLFVQMVSFYICPALVAVLIACVTVISISRNFLYRSGVDGSLFSYLVFSLGVLAAIYLIYFGTVYFLSAGNFILEKER